MASLLSDVDRIKLTHNYLITLITRLFLDSLLESRDGPDSVGPVKYTFIRVTTISILLRI